MPQCRAARTAARSRSSPARPRARHRLGDKRITRGERVALSQCHGRRRATGACYDASDGGDLCGLTVSASDAPARQVAASLIQQSDTTISDCCNRRQAAVGAAHHAAAQEPTGRSRTSPPVTYAERRLSSPPYERWPRRSAGLSRQCGARLARRQSRNSARRRTGRRDGRRAERPAFHSSRVRASAGGRTTRGPAFLRRHVSRLRSDLPCSSPTAGHLASSPVRARSREVG
jgi:hypothetical protein